MTATIVAIAAIAISFFSLGITVGRWMERKLWE